MCVCSCLICWRGSKPAPKPTHAVSCICSVFGFVVCLFMFDLLVRVQTSTNANSQSRPVPMPTDNQEKSLMSFQCCSFGRQSINELDVFPIMSIWIILEAWLLSRSKCSNHVHAFKPFALYTPPPRPRRSRVSSLSGNLFCWQRRGQ